MSRNLMETKNDKLVRMVNVSKSFGEVTALKEENFEVGYNEVVGLIGDNGAGKSTLIKILTGVHAPDKGEIYFKGKKITHHSVEKARELGIETVYQERALGEQQTLWRNIFMGREMTSRLGFLQVKKAKEETDKILKEVIGFTAVGLTPDSVVERLSGGEKQGVAIARALHFQAELIILDEPTMALSLSETKKVLNFVKGVKEQGKSCIFITHNIYHVYPAADRFVVLDRGRTVGEFEKKDISLEELVDKL
ncbi:MAG: ATP-binding cassette domain-containing protein, partial [bacterium]